MAHPSSSAKPSTRQPTIHETARAAFARPDVRADAAAALALFRSYCEQPMPRIPGCDTGIRIGIRIHLGHTVDQSAAREYAYRWLLYLRSWHNHSESRSRTQFIHDAMCYPAPHLLGQ